MSLSVAKPTLVLNELLVQATPWKCGLAEGGVVDGDFRNWDARTTVRIERTISIDPALVAAQLDLGSGLPDLVLVVRRGTGYGRVARNLVPLVRILLGSDGSPVTIDETLDSTTLAGQLWLHTDLVLGAEPADPGPLSPVRIGTRLWSDVLCISLEPDVMRLPTEIGSFARLFPDRSWCHAPWCLRWYSDNPRRDLASSLRLYLNSDREEHCESIRRLDSISLEPMMADVMGQIIERAGLVEPGEDEDDWPSGSVGRQAQYWRELAFPGRSPTEVRELLVRRPGEFRATVLATAELASGGQ